MKDAKVFSIIVRMYSLSGLVYVHPRNMGSDIVASHIRELTCRALEGPINVSLILSLDVF